MNTGWMFKTPVWRMLCTAALLWILPVAASPVPAQDTDAYETYDLVPARLRGLSGDVQLQRAREQDRVAATLNLPVYPGDFLHSEDGRAEIQLPDGSLVWIDGWTGLEILSLYDPYAESGDGAFLSLREGTLEVEYRPLVEQDAGEFRIDTLEGSVLLLKPGRYRLDAREGTTTLTTYRGLAELAGDDGSVWVRSGQRTRAELARGPDRPWAVNTLRRDDFGAWCEDRLAAYVAEYDAGDSREYVEAIPRPARHYVTELDGYGDWVHIVEFGWVWRPTVYQIGWRPYYHGYWTWCPGGWTWVAYEPWGWYPYHYGRWHWVTTAGWVWIPGGVYSGAWVSWAVTPTYIGWAPLDFYNRPVYLRAHVTGGAVSRYGDAWHFLPASRFGDRNISRSIVKAGRVPAIQGAVTTRSLPRFSPSEMRTRPEAGRRLLREAERTAPRQQIERPGASARERVPFRAADRREAARDRAPAKRTENLPPRIQRPIPPDRQRIVTPRDGSSRVPQNRGVRPPAGSRDTQADRQRPAPRRDLNAPPTQRPAPERPAPPERTRPARPEDSRPQASPETGRDDPSREVLRRIFRERRPAPARPEGGAISPGPEDGKGKERPQEARPARPPSSSRQDVSRARPPARQREAAPPRERGGKEKSKGQKKDDGR
jgi:hypothetical protein